MAVEIIVRMDLWHCPKCGGKTDTYRHPYARVWCTTCGHVLRTEGDRTILHETAEGTEQANEPDHIPDVEKKV